MPVGRSAAPAGRRRKRRAASLGAAAVAAACAAAVFFFGAPPDRPFPPPAQVAGPSTTRVVEPTVAFPPPPAEAGAAPPAAGRDPVPCVGCLNAAAARDVAETLVAASGGAYLDVRVELAHARSPGHTRIRPTREESGTHAGRSPGHTRGRRRRGVWDTRESVLHGAARRGRRLRRRWNMVLMARTPATPSLRVGIGLSLHPHFALDSTGIC